MSVGYWLFTTPHAIFQHTPLDKNSKNENASSPIMCHILTFIERIMMNDLTDNFFCIIILYKPSFYKATRPI